MPLAGYWLSRRRWSPGLQTAALFAFAAGYVFLGAAFYWQALRGVPLLRL